MSLIAGLLLWSLTHLSKAVFPQGRRALIQRLGEGPYKGLFSLLILLSLFLIVWGWQQWPPRSLYVPPVGLRHATLLLVPIAVVLFFAARLPTDLKRVLRHPQLTGVKLWAFAHLLANGETRSVVLFGGLLAWAVAEVIAIKRRDGAVEKPAAVGMPKTIASTIISLALAAVILFAHPWIAGVSVIPGG